MNGTPKELKIIYEEPMSPSLQTFSPSHLCCISSCSSMSIIRHRALSVSLVICFVAAALMYLLPPCILNPKANRFYSPRQIGSAHRFFLDVVFLYRLLPENTKAFTYHSPMADARFFISAGALIACTLSRSSTSLTIKT